ncbi:flagellar biosynthesis protein FlgA [Arsenicitalea aurantiaca]|uniref:Flagellar biosynthesis protein FlgA n=1 Tax=Arsenicitalea aurantiaca TaxID=1783274 RepID=A0A433XKE5_9HYPH|nr:flagellar biosynthesis protein FlgA [Arsenicitalea aurantiaca]RUT34551.1 flagellar biosynthesis protein FlgA [Arsenicitalea aurantiaca]
MNFHTYFKGAEPVETCIVGTGSFGRSFLVQSRRVPLMNTRIAIDVSAETAARAIASIGVAEGEIAICRSREEAAAAWATGKHIAADDIAIVLELPFGVVVEATGHPEAGARHARLAIEAGKHVVMVSKEADSVVGPGLALLAQQQGVVITPVDGDQPSLLVDLVTWAELLGFEIIAAGKSSEYDFVHDPAAGTLTSNGVVIDAMGFAGLERLREAGAADLLEARSRAASAFKQHLTPDLCEMSLVANATGLRFDRDTFHAPIARIGEVPSFLSLKEDGGVLDAGRSLEVFHCLRAPDEVSFAGGVFVVVRCEDEESWTLLADKGHVVSRTGATAMIYNPRHLLGLEAATSVLAAAARGVSQGMAEPQHFVDLVARADVDLPAGTVLTAAGHHHEIEGVSAAILPACALGPQAPVPFYLAANRPLLRPVKAGKTIVLEDVELDEASDLLKLRRLQDAHFFG